MLSDVDNWNSVELFGGAAEHGRIESETFKKPGFFLFFWRGPFRFCRYSFVQLSIEKKKTHIIGLLTYKLMRET